MLNAKKEKSVEKKIKSEKNSKLFFFLLMKQSKAMHNKIILVISKLNNKKSTFNEKGPR